MGSVQNNNILKTKSIASKTNIIYSNISISCFLCRILFSKQKEAILHYMQKGHRRWWVTGFFCFLWIDQDRPQHNIRMQNDCVMIWWSFWHM